MLIGDLSRLGAQRHARKVALIMSGNPSPLTLTYEELNDRSNQLAHALLASGVRLGDRVAVLSHNRLDYAVITQAVAKCGAILVPLNFRFGPDEIRHILSDSQPVALFVEASFQEALEGAYARGAHQPRIVHVLDDISTLTHDQPSSPPLVGIDPQSPCVILYTSGTTGFPKGVIVSHATYFRMYIATAFEGRLRRDDVFLIAVPLFHAAGLNLALHQCLFMGATGIIHRGPFEPDSILRLIEQHRITLAILVPTTLALLAFHERIAQYDTSSLDKIFYGSMPITPSTLARARQVFPRVGFTQLYGSTESGMVSVLTPEDHERWSQTTGRQVLVTESRIVDDEGRDVPVGSIGEIIVNQRTMGMIGYWRNEEATRAAIRDGWIYTGDLARVEPEGLFTLVDRRNDVIISGGENIYPKEVENVIASHPAVREVAVFGIPDERYGEAVCAAVVLWPGHNVTAADIQEHARRASPDTSAPARSTSTMPYPAIPAIKSKRRS